VVPIPLLALAIKVCQVLERLVLVAGNMAGGVVRGYLRVVRMEAK